MEALSIFVLALLGMAISYVEERFGKFQNLPSNTKQLVNAILTFILPGIVALLAPYWKPEFGDPAAVVSAVVLIAAPVVIWLASQVGHQTDRILQNTGNQGQFKALKK